MTPISIQSLRKAFGATVAVKEIDLEIPAGDLFFLLGPSGCGKTTLLRMIAGFTDPTSGKILFGDKDVTHLPPNKRNTGMVFQGYALWPHMTVAQNVAFGLEVRKVGKAELAKRVEEALDAVQLSQLADRKINQLSGGQQQRVALARALVIRPTVLLLDEPLSNLDAKLRIEMRSSIRKICKTAGITGVYVTHDQKEALSMADGIAVLSSGEVMQAGPPRKLYERPHNRFVAGFLGETNFIHAEVKERNGTSAVLETSFGLLQTASIPEDMPGTGGVTCSIRPECMQLRTKHDDTGGTNHFDAKRQDTTYLGEMAQYHLTAGEGDAAVPLDCFELNPRLLDAADDDLRIYVDPRDVIVLRD